MELKYAHVTWKESEGRYNMAYNRTYYYKKVLEAQLLVRRVQNEHRGLPMTEIYRQYIKDKFYISKSTFDRWMECPAARELSKIEVENKD